MRAVASDNAFKWSMSGSFVLAASSVLALAYFIFGEPFALFAAGESIAIAFGYWMVIGPVCWLVLSLGLIAVYRRRGLPALLGGPFAALPLIFTVSLLSAI